MASHHSFKLGVADALPKWVTYQIIEPIFHLPQPVQLSCWETKLSDMLECKLTHAAVTAITSNAKKALSG